MAFTVETGTGASDANSFASVAAFDAYHSERGNATVVAWTQTRKEQNLVKATDYLSATFRSSFVGSKKSVSQRLPWPRINAFYNGDDDPLNTYCQQNYAISETVIPQCLIEATCDLAVDADTNTLTPNVKPGASQITKKKIGPLEINYQSRYNASILWRRAAGMINSILRGSSSSVQIVRS